MNNTMTNPSDIEMIVMKRVRRMRILFLILSAVVFAVLTAVAALWGIGREVWVARVFENGPQDLVGRVEYLWYAFLHTRLIVQALSVLTLGSLLLLGRELSGSIVAFIRQQR